jgi:hypothetical protein
VAPYSEIFLQVMANGGVTPMTMKYLFIAPSLGGGDQHAL